MPLTPPGQRAHGLDEQLGQAVRGAQAQQAAIAGGAGGVGILAGHLGESPRRRARVGRPLGLGLRAGPPGSGWRSRAPPPALWARLSSTSAGSTRRPAARAGTGRSRARSRGHSARVAVAQALSSSWLRSSSRNCATFRPSATSRRRSSATSDLVLPRHGLLGLVHRVVVDLEAVSRARCSCAFSLISRSSTSRASCGRGGSARPAGPAAARYAAGAARTSLLVMGSELTTATMKSAGRGPVSAGAAGGQCRALVPIGRDAQALRLHGGAAASSGRCAAGQASQGPRRAEGWFMAVLVVVVAEAAGRTDLLAQVLVAGDVVPQGLQGVGAQARREKPTNSSWNSSRLLEDGGAALQALEHHAANPAARCRIPARPRHPPACGPAC
jgi:hypothetical protein